MRYVKVKLGDLKHGDQIAVMGNVANLSPLLRPLMTLIRQTYYHHGIYDAENMAVYHFTGADKANAKPQKSDFTDFFAGHTQLYRVEYEDNEECLPVHEVMKRAEEAVNRSSTWPGYDLIKNNCESFATYLKTGKAYSKQAFEALVFAAVRIGPVVAGSTAVSIGGSIGGSNSTLS